MSSVCTREESTLDIALLVLYFNFTGAKNWVTLGVVVRGVRVPVGWATKLGSVGVMEQDPADWGLLARPGACKLYTCIVLKLTDYT